MSSIVAQVRKDLKKTLERIQPYPVEENIPEIINPPRLYIREGAPLVTMNTDQFGGLAVRFSVIAVIAPTTNALAVQRLDELVDRLLIGLMDECPHIEVNEYAAVNSADGQKYLSAKIDITTHLQYVKDDE